MPTSLKLVVLKGDMYCWHDWYGYISFKALEKLPIVVKGIKITDLLTQELFREAGCHTCCIAEAD
jgi:hypothetical protein